MLALMPKLKQQFTAFAEEVLEGHILSDRERAITILATAFAMGDENALQQAVINAKQVGVTNEEIGYISAVVIALQGQKIAELGVVTTEAPPKKQSSCCCS